MRRAPSALVFAGLAVAIANHATAQRSEPTVRVSFRVTSVRPAGRLVIDRGTRDQIATDDLVVLLPRSGRRLRGKVLRVDGRSAVVELDERNFAAAPGTRGEVRVPASRFATKPRPRATVVRPRPQPHVPKVVPEARPGKDALPTKKPTWKNKDEKWKPGMPLLTRVRPVRPEDRAWQMTGRFFTTGVLSQTPNNGSSNSYFRAGTDLTYENLFSRGGELHIDTEFNFKTEQTNIRGADILLRRLSYTLGGTRFATNRLDGGRFLQYEMPEFGVLDGVAWSRRLEGGHRFGASLGFLPEPDDDYNSFSDFQLAAFYKWVSDEREEFAISGGFQKTFHHGRADRDLLVGKIQYLPDDGWDVHGTAWVDFYTNKDANKKQTIELTQSVLTVGRRFDNGSGADITLWHQKFPDIRRRQNRPITANRLRVDRTDRLTLNGWTLWDEKTRLHGAIAGWTDEDENGSSIEAGADVAEMLFEDGRTDITAFANQGQHEAAIGVRVATGRYTSLGRWDASYDLTYHHRVAFPADFADIFQHRFFGQHEFAMTGGWDLSAWADANLWDSDVSIAVGFYMQKRF